MARTKDPTAATLKSWETRRRNQEKAAGIRTRSQPSGGGDVVQQRGDFGVATSGRAAVAAIVRTAGHFAAREVVDDGIKMLSLPVEAVLGLTEIRLESQSNMTRPATIRGGIRVPERVALGGYAADLMRAGINADALIREGGLRSKPARAARTLSHEIGHHAHLSRLSDAAAAEWASISKNGKNCEVTSYGMKNTTEHFAEAFSHYAQPDPFLDHAPRRAWLKRAEPEAYAFMERLWTDKSMWRAGGHAEYNRRRRIQGGLSG